ncbi:hypothetical protein, partial [Eisenbergiella porci]
ITQISGTKIPYQAIAADKDGRIYLAEWKSGESDQRVLVLNEDCSLAGSIACDDGDIRGLGRARNGEVYGVLMAGHDWIPAVVRFNVQSFTIDKKYSNVLPTDVGVFDTMGARTNSDLLIWGPCGIYAYNTVMIRLFPRVHNMNSPMAPPCALPQEAGPCSFPIIIL